MDVENHAVGLEPVDTQVGPATPATSTPDVPSEKDATAESFERLKPIAYAIIDMVAEAKLPIGNNTNMEKENVFALLLQPFDKLRTIALSSLNRSANKAVDLKMGKQFGDITIADLDEILKSEVVAG